MTLTLAAWIAFQSIGAPLTQAAEMLPVQAYATDTVAGYPSALRTSLISPNQDVRFVVEKPDGTVVQIPAQADLEGVAKTDFYGHQTKQAGKYKVAVNYPGSAQASPQTSFNVYPDQVSTTQSTLKSTTQMVAAGTEVTFLVVTLYDQYRNPIVSHSVKLISSRSEDRILMLQNGTTDLNGRVNFKVSSPNPGVSVFTAVDGTVNQVLDSREEVVFFQALPASSLSSLGSMFRADIGQGTVEPLAGPVDHFDIEGLPAQAKVGQELSMTIVAKDQNGNVAKGYTGTVLISAPDDENATLPGNGEYTFKDTDQGKFTFNLSLAFTTLGKQTVQVLDKKKFSIAGEKTVEIIPKEGIVPGPASPTLVIKSPVDGAQLGNSTLVISGQGNPNINLKVFMDDAKIGDITQTDSDGFFTFEAKDLSSASHVFYVMSDNGEVSKPVSVLIDTIAPVLNAFEIFPEGNSLPGEQLSVTLRSESKLESAKLRLQGAEVELKESASEPGKYEATLTAPDADGSYGVDVILADALGNKAEILNKGTIAVQKPAPINPPKVEGLEATPGDSLIQLKWVLPTATDKPIQKFRISYGTSLTALDKTVDTVDSTPAWELRDLANGTQYFVNLKALDGAGLESLEPSVTIAATPVAPPPPVVVEPIPPAIQTPPIQVIPFDGAVSLSWIPFVGVQAYHYKVFIGTGPGQYTDSVTTPDNSPSIVISDLINNAPYTFAVAALDLNGNVISPLSQEVQATPSGAGFHSAAPTALPSDFGGTIGQPPAYSNYTPPSNLQSGNLGNVPSTTQTGPETVWVLFASFAFAYFLYHHKKRVLR